MLATVTTRNVYITFVVFLGESNMASGAPEMSNLQGTMGGLKLSACATLYSG